MLAKCQTKNELNDNAGKQHKNTKLKASCTWTSCKKNPWTLLA